ncbi:MFS family permease [Methanomicrobium sp. W14]|uniref:MFS transporter n=1 Tax=Methanomicrobium sp. W14 TaxID=2817839 RepID=UPI001AE66165|nr:MFS transporter [Methanomicrobium sp. W14]MBP2132324.1 MFS family permease [Methanomicrobium sp. W14]
MKNRLTAFCGTFIIMALSNAIVPVLPSFADEMPLIQGAIYSAYFFGAFITVLPAGMLSDRINRVLLIRAGLILTIISGLMLLELKSPVYIISARLIEGIAAGLFVSCAMSWINEQEQHTKLAGYYFASLNLGLVLGLLSSGILNPYFGPSGGIIVFTALSLVPALIGFIADFNSENREKTGSPAAIAKKYFLLYLSIIILTGATGAVTSLYPDFSDGDPLILSIQIGAMNIATIGASLAAPRMNLKPVPTISSFAVVTAAAVFLSYAVPYADTIATITVFALIGAAAGFIMVSQMNFLAETGYRQGAVMGLFNASGYAGMTFLPLFAGLLAQYYGYLPAFLSISVLSVFMALSIRKCTVCKT